MTDRHADPDVKLSRRAALGAVAGAGAASLLRPPSGLGAVASAAPRPSVFEQAIASLRAGSSSAFTAPRPFEMVGVEWSSPASARIQLRTRREGGPWSPWALASVVGHGPDEPSRSRRLIGDGIWTGQASQVQLRSSRPLNGVRLHFVDVGAGALRAAKAAALPLATPVLTAGGGQPPIIARRAWARGHAPPAVPPLYGAIKLAFVHHTENPNGYSPGEVPAMLLAIYQFHRFVRGWDDLGYNFVIDLFGRIWEARQGGIDEAVVGAQAGGYNAVSTGISILGTFSSVLPSPAALSALRHLLAWKLSLHGAPTQGHVTVRVNSADAFYTPFAPGAHVSLPRIAGHRDGDSTSCPGDALYARLPAIRSRVAALAGQPLRLVLSPPPAKVKAGTVVALSGVLRSLAGQPIAGAPIEIRGITTYGAGVTITSTTTAADGTWGAPVTVQRRTLVQALHRLSPAAVSGTYEIAVRRR